MASWVFLWNHSWIQKIFFQFLYSAFISLSWAFLLMMEISSQFSIGTLSRLPESPQSCRCHWSLLPSQPGRLSFQSVPCPKVSSAPFYSLLTEQGAVPSQAGSIQQFRNTRPHGNSETQNLLVAFEQPVAIRTTEMEKENIYCTGKFAV